MTWGKSKLGFLRMMSHVRETTRMERKLDNYIYINNFQEKHTFCANDYQIKEKTIHIR